MEFAFSYVGYLIRHLVYAWPLLGFIALVIISLGLLVGRIESWKWSDAVYWAFITATTVGYGDIRPLRQMSRIISVLIALVGVTFTGLIVALAINAASLTLSQVEHPEPDPTQLPQQQ